MMWFINLDIAAASIKAIARHYAQHNIGLKNFLVQDQNDRYLYRFTVFVPLWLPPRKHPYSAAGPRIDDRHCYYIGFGQDFRLCRVYRK